MLLGLRRRGRLDGYLWIKSLIGGVEWHRFRRWAVQGIGRVGGVA